MKVKTDSTKQGAMKRFQGNSMRVGNSSSMFIQSYNCWVLKTRFLDNYIIVGKQKNDSRVRFKANGTYKNDLWALLQQLEH